MRTHRPSSLVELLAAFSLGAVLAIPGVAGGQLFSIASQNCLHLGWGKPMYQQNKEHILRGFFGAYDVILLQEVMRSANVANVRPGGYHWYVTPTQGPGSYREAYAFLVNPRVNFVTDVISTVPGFSRPPAGLWLEEGGQCAWVVDYHAIFNSIGARRAEVRRIRQVYQGFQATSFNGRHCDRVVMVGDWNLGANDPVFLDFMRNHWPIAVQPNNQTSLKRNGGLSQPYDHALWDTTVADVRNCHVIPVPNPPGTNAGWRAQVSDHLGIACEVH